jgi:hypothetical protein
MRRVFTFLTIAALLTAVSVRADSTDTRAARAFFAEYVIENSLSNETGDSSRTLILLAIQRDRCPITYADLNNYTELILT